MCLTIYHTKAIFMNYLAPTSLASTEISADIVLNKLKNKGTFVLNIVAHWCPDCTKSQLSHLLAFRQSLNENGLPFFQYCPQIERRVFISSKDESLTEQFGGHGFPRTVLVIRGKITDANNVEVIEEKSLQALATRFINQLI